MKTQKEIEEKYEKLNKMMSDNLPTMETIQKMQDMRNSGKRDLVIVQEMIRSSETYHIDGMRYILEWVMGNHD